ncbi:hypothetical protein L7F22_062155 [Adiantum nelumboides]|nr:hypothetical protein [Adiantum nelumboides]
MNPNYAKKVKEEIDNLLKAGFITEVETSDWLFPIVIVSKKNGKLRACVDYRKLNSQTIKDPFPLPFIDMMLCEIERHETYNFMDGYSGYNQLKIAPKDREKTTFITEWDEEDDDEEEDDDKEGHVRTTRHPSSDDDNDDDQDHPRISPSSGMVVHGHDTTLPVTMDDMLLHCWAVARGATRPLLVGDLPFGSYEQSSAQAMRNATRLLKEGNMDAGKLEGEYGSCVAAIKANVEACIAMMGHVGLTPQAINTLGGFALKAKPHLVLVYHDILGMMRHPHYAKVTPKFCKRYAHIDNVINEALVSYRDNVTNGSFPSAVYSPYKIDQKEVESFLDDLKYKGLSETADAASNAIKQMNEHENISKARKKSD